MLIDIDKIVVGDRIRKDFGDIEELADNIKKNGLLNPITINNRHVLLAGERRLRACKLLGWSQVDVRMVESEDEAQDIEIELSENTVRRNFTGSELADGIRRQMEIEAAKAKERMTDPMQTFAEGQKGTARDKAAEQFGISGEQARKTLYVADNSDLLDPADFADWDEGKLSTNKAYQRIKAAKEQAEHERDEAREEAEGLGEDIRDMQEEIAALEKQADKAYEDGYKAATRNAQPQVVTREVESEASKKRIGELEHERDVYLADVQKLRKRNEDMRKELNKARDILGMDKTMHDVRRDVQYLINATNSYVRQYGGLTWTAESFEQVDEPTLEDLRKAVRNLATFSNALMTSLESTNE